MEPRFRNLLEETKHKMIDVDFAGRNISASTATGYGKLHAAEMAAYLDQAMTI